MNELELLSRYGGAEPIDPARLDATIDAILSAPDHHDMPARVMFVRRRRPRRAVLVGASAAAAAAIAFATITTTGSSPVRPAQNTPSGPELVAFVTHHSVTALDAAGGYVLRTVQQDPRGTSTSWRGPNQTLYKGANGDLDLQTWAPDGSSTVLNVDYQHHSWYESTFPAPTHTGTPPTPANSSPLGSNGTEPSPATIAAWFKNPGIKIVGTSVIGSTDTYQLQIPALDPNGEPVAGETITAWVDTATYLPVRMTRSMPAAQGADNGVRVTIPASTVTDDFSWQPATPQALSVFEITPPASFRHVTDPAQQPVPPGQ